jgi:hypothetical protein
MSHIGLPCFDRNENRVMPARMQQLTTQQPAS